MSIPVAPQRPLKNQKALVTDANSGIGEACVVALGAADAAVGVNYISDPEAANRVVQVIQSGGGEAIALKADVGQESEVQKIFADATPIWGPSTFW